MTEQLAVGGERAAGAKTTAGDGRGDAFDTYLREARTCAGRVAPLLAALTEADPAELLPLPGSGSTAERFRRLARVAEADVTAARVLEPHADAVAILAEAGEPSPPTGTTWGVFAAEAPGTSLEASHDGGRWALTGRKAWCSLGGTLTNALVTASVGDARRMFAVELAVPQVEARPAGWVARGLAEVVSGPLDFRGADATPVGADGWYLARPGFRWGGVGVAACWWGGCLPIAAAVAERVRSRPSDALATASLGRLYRALEAGRLALRDAAATIDAQHDGRARDGAVLSHATRGVVADGVVLALSLAREVLGPAALAFDESLARRCADLELYVSQYHWGRDDASLARTLPAGVIEW